MSAVTSCLPLAAILVPVAGLPGVILLGRRPRLRDAFAVLVAAAMFAVAVSMLPAVLDGREPSLAIARFLPGVSIALRVDPLGMLFGLVASSLWIATQVYSSGYMRGLQEHSQTRFHCFFALALFSTLGAAFAANLLTLYLFYELLSFATWPLVAHHQDSEARVSGRKYLGYIAGGSIGLVLPAMIAVSVLAGGLDFAHPGGIAGKLSPFWTGVLLLAFLYGFAKAALMPLHAWLPAAMVAPTPVSALLHAVAVVKVGAFSIVRVVTGIFGVDLLANLDLGWLITLIAGATMITASLIALTQDGLKRRLAFSTIGQLAYIVLGVGMLDFLGVMGGSLHIATHAAGKITLFFCAGAIYVATGEKQISRMAGIGKRMPWTMTAFFLGSLSIIGIPPTGGFLSKWLLLSGALQAGSWLPAGVLLLSSLLGAAYFLPITYQAFFAKPVRPDFAEGVREAPAACLVPLLITAVLSVVLFFYPDPLYTLARMAAGG
jgi:multicomponent Na+:H+ antiporter subunit D